MNIFLIISIVLAIFLVVGFVIGYRQTMKGIRKTRATLAKTELLTVCAGSHSEEIPEKKDTYSIKYNSFILPSTQSLDTDKYLAYVVEGNSMQYCNIHTNDIVFVPKESTIGNLKKFPSVIVLHNQRNERSGCRYKLRRAWCVCDGNLSDEDLNTRVSNVMKTGEYLILKENASEHYDSDEAMLAGFKEKLKAFREQPIGNIHNGKIIISSTFNVKSGKIHFSIHSGYEFVGVVKYVSECKSN